MKPQKYIKKVLYVLSALYLLVFFSSTGFRDKTTTGGWYQQYLPTEINKPITGMVFIDSLTGFIVTGADTVGNTNYILKTTNGGDNWAINFSAITKFHKIQFINDSTGFAMGALSFYKTTNRGVSWNSIGLPGYPVDLYVLNTDTMFMADDESIIGGLWRTTNGGTSWQMLVNFGSGNPEAVYFYNKNIGFIVRYGTDTYKTIDGGYNWFYIPSGGFGDIHFFDSLTGYIVSGFNFKKTTDGGLNWFTSQFSNIFQSGMTKFSAINKDTIWGVGGTAYINGNYSGIIYKTTNGGISLGYQIPLYNNNIGIYVLNSFSNKNNGWAYFYQNTGVHTNMGGSDTTFFTGIKLVEEYIPTGYLLRQNYPNPFNPQTNIPFELSESGYVTLKIYDITGREVKELINGKWGKASYVAEFNAENLASGIYFYRLKFVSDATKKEFIDTKKMMLLK
jgi:photosystem II stability/assembly factor-like uncharacterized protein